MNDNDAAKSIRAAILCKGSDRHGDAALDAMESTAAGLSGADEPARAKKSQDQDSKRQGTAATLRPGQKISTIKISPDEERWANIGNGVMARTVVNIGTLFTTT